MQMPQLVFALQFTLLSSLDYLTGLCLIGTHYLVLRLGVMLSPY